MNLKHKKKLLREEILPDLDKMIRASVDSRMKGIEDQIRYENDKLNKERQEQIEKEKRNNFMGEVRMKLGEFTEKLSDIHISLPPESKDSLESSRTDKTHENVVIDIIGQKRD